MTVTSELLLPPTRSKLGEYVLGPYPLQRDGISRLLRVVLIHICSLLIMSLTSLAGWIPAWQVAVMSAYFPTGWLVFYTLMRSGWSARLADPSLDTAMTMFGMSTVVAIYAMMDVGRGLALQLVCVVLVMHIDRLRLRQAMLITFGSVAALITTLIALWWFTPDRIDLRIEIYNLALATVLLPIAAFLIGETYRVSTRAMQHSGMLATTLEQLRGQSLQDDITGLPNQRHMTNLMLGEVKRQGRTGQVFCLTCFDAAITGPDQSVETRNEVLRQIAQLAGKFIDPADTLACWSNGRLLLMQPATRLPAMQATIDRLRQAVREYGWARIDKNLRVTLSAGSVEHQFTDSLDVTLERVQRALQRAQQSGLDCSATDPDLPAHRNAPIAANARATTALLQAEPISATPSAPTRQRMRPVMRVAADGGAATAHDPVNAMPAWLMRGLNGLKTLLLGADPALRERLRLPLAGSLVYASWLILLHSYALPKGMVAPGFARWLTTGDLIGMLAFYPLIRSGWSIRWADPSLMLPQMLYGCGICAISFVTTPDFRPVALQVMCFVQLFGMATLTARQTRLMAVSTILMQLGALAWVWVAQTGERHIMIEAFTVSTSCFIVACIGLRSFRFSQVRQQVQQEQGALAQAVERIRSQLFIDALTGLFNHQHMADQLDREIARHRRTGQGFCIALIGLDLAARANVRQAAIENLLTRFAQTARNLLRQTDLLGRWSDQTFLALLPDTETGTQGVPGLERLRQHVAAQPAPEAAPDLRATLSCGIAEFRADEPVARLLARAERGLYTARASGGNRCVLAD